MARVTEISQIYDRKLKALREVRTYFVLPNTVRKNFLMKSRGKSQQAKEEQSMK